MVGSRHPEAASGVSSAKSNSANTALLDDICLDRRYVKAGRVIPKAEQKLDERLENIIEAEIIPRLMLIHKRNADSSKVSNQKIGSEELAKHVEEFTGLVLRHETAIVSAYVKSLLQTGLDLERLFLGLFAPTARRLGEMWEADKIDFVDVTIGTSRLQQMLHHFTLPVAKDAGEPARRVLLLPTPTEQHTFGLLMVADFFRREGWEVYGGSPLNVEEFLALVADQWFALIGFSLSGERLIDILASTIKRVRQNSRNQAVQIMVGGPIFAEDEAFKGAVGADLVVTDAKEAVKIAGGILAHSR